MKKQVLKVLVLMLAFAFLVGNSNVIAYNQNNLEQDQTQFDYTQIEESYRTMYELATNSTEITDPTKVNDLIILIKNAINNKKVTVNHQNGKLDYSKTKILEVRQNNEMYTTITVPVEGGTYSLLSNMTFVLFNNEILGYSETLITRSIDDKFIIDTYYDGELIENNQTDLDYVDNNEIQESLDIIHENAENGFDYTQTKGIPEIAGCIVAVAGINGVVAYLIAGTCIASCPAIPPICAACIGGVCAMGAADIGAVIACFNL